MTKIFVTMETGYCGSEGYQVIDVEYTEEELADRMSSAALEVDKLSWEMAKENYSMYGFDEDDSEEEGYNCEGSWEIYNPEEHNGSLMQSQIDELY